MKKIEDVLVWLDDRCKHERHCADRVRKKMGSENYAYTGFIHALDAYERVISFINEDE